MRGVVTGGAGFLGSHVADVLAESGHEIVIADLQRSTRFETRIADLGDVGQLIASFSGADFVCHMAAVGDVYLAAEKPALASHVNVTGTANVCEAAIAAGVRTLVYASTWEVYGEPHYQPIDELHPCEPDHPYNITKLAGERLALAYGERDKGLSVVALRLGTAYGTRMRPNSVFSLFTQRALRGETITIHGTGQQARQFTHARDIGRAFVAAVERPTTEKVYNTVAKELVTIRRLAELVSASIPTTVVYAEARAADVPSARVSSERIERDLGWRAEVEFTEGLSELIASAREAASGKVGST